MFFGTKLDRPNLKVMLEPMSMEPTIHSIHFTYGLEQFTDSAHSAARHTLFWPQVTNQKFSISFMSKSGQRTVLQEHGPWALYRMLWRNKPQGSINPKYFEITFDANGNAAKYLLKANRMINGDMCEGVMLRWQTINHEPDYGCRHSTPDEQGNPFFHRTEWSAFSLSRTWAH